MNECQLRGCRTVGCSAVQLSWRRSTELARFPEVHPQTDRPLLGVSRCQGVPDGVCGRFFGGGDAYRESDVAFGSRGDLDGQGVRLEVQC